RLAPLFLVTASLSGQSLLDCRAVFIEPMPESMDRFVSARLVQWGQVKVVTVKEKADCVFSFQRPKTEVAVDSTGSPVVPKKTTVEAKAASGQLPEGSWGKVAALELVHQESGTVLWAHTATTTWSWSDDPGALAGKFVGRLKSDYQKKEREAVKRRK